MISGREFILTLIARRSRHYAGTRFVNSSYLISRRIKSFDLFSLVIICCVALNWHPVLQFDSVQT